MSLSKRWGLSLLLALFFLLLCSLGAAVSPQPGEPGQPDPAVRVLQDLGGRCVPMPQEVKRAACLDVLCYQKLFMLGESGRLTVMYLTDAPWMELINPEVKDIPKIEGEPNLEDLLLRGVDLAFFAYDVKRLAPKLDRLGIAGLISQPQGPRARNQEEFLKETKDSVLIYGQALGGAALARAKHWCAYFDERVGYVTSRTAALPAEARPKTYYLRGPTALHTQGKSGDTYWYGELAGADMVVKNDNLAAKGPVSMEKIIAWDPDVVLVGRQYPLELVLGDSRWRNVGAVRKARVYPLPNGVFYWDGGLEGVLLMQYLAKKLHPELFVDLDLEAEIKKFYAVFYRYELSDEECRLLLAGLSPSGERVKLFNN